MRNRAFQALAIAGTLAAASVAAGPASAARPGSPVLHLKVGASVLATVGTPDGSLTCGDNADCTLEVRRNSELQITARAPHGHALRWTGCTRQLAADRCVVSINSRVTQVVVR